MSEPQPLPQPSPEPTVPFEISLSVGDYRITAKSNLPTGPARVVDLLPILHQFSDAMTDIGIQEVTRQGKTVTCAPHCGACCRQMVPLTYSEARLLIEWMITLPEHHRSAIIARFDAAIARMDESGILQRLVDYRPDRETLRQLGSDYFDLAIPCPFLEDESCGVHPIRPLRCRDYLVTSPAELCKFPYSAKPSVTWPPISLFTKLIDFPPEQSPANGPGPQTRQWVPLTLMLEWAKAADTEIPPTQLPAAELIQAFFASFADKPDASEEPPPANTFNSPA
jgi:Fe-S-cluster containining protein